MVYSENLIIEFQVPNYYTTDDWDLSIDQIVHGYRGLHSKFEELKELQRGPFGNSGACNNNVNCPVGDDWQVEKKSVALIVSGGSAACTGALVNNTANDGHPYFLTANHCLGGVGNWVFYFNHESATCNGNTGPTNQTVSGASTVSSNGGSDFGLLEINNGNSIPGAFNVEFAGWDNSGVTPSSQVGIHHPSGDLKKISFDNNPATMANWGNAATWHIGNWEDGTTEPGSSGSPLFDQDHRIIGQLYGGTANCSNNIDDYYGRFNVSWDGSSASSRLRDWLDPGNTGVSTLDGYPTGFVVVALDAAAQSLEGVEEGQILCETEVTPIFTLRNSGQDNLTECTINWEVDNVAQTPMMWTGDLANNQTDDITFPTQTFAPGVHSLDFMIVSANNGTDLNPNNDDLSVSFTIVDGDEISVDILTDDYGDETTWEVTDGSNNVVASGSGYSDNTQYNIPACLADGCYTFTIYDSYGDGICCGFGTGDYEVLSPAGDVMGSGAEFADDESFSFCLPYVVAPPVAAFTAGSTDICTGESVTFNNTSTPNNATYAWTFESGSPATSSAQNPSVTYNSAGTFDVSLTVTNGAGSDNSSQTNYITVNPSPSASTSSTMENLWTGGGNGTATVNPTGGTPPYTYSWSPGSGSTASISGLDAGNYTVTITDDEGCTATSTVAVGNNVGINDIELAEAISVYPNPTSGVLNIEFPVETDIIDITVTDVVGRMIRKVNVLGLQRTTIDFTALTEGVYHLNFYTTDKKATKKVVHLK